MKLVKWTAIIIVGISIVLGLFVAFFDWNLLRGYIGEKVTERTGREFSINGNLDVDLWPFPPRVIAQDLRFANAAWGTEPRMLNIEQLDFSIDIGSLLKGTIVLPHMALVAPEIVLEKSRDGKRNWIFGKEGDSGGALPEIGHLTLDRGTLIFRDPAIATGVTILVEPASATQDARDAGIKFNAQGKYQGLPLRAQGVGESALALQAGAQPYDLDVDAQIGATRVSLDGAITDLARFAAIDARLELSGEDLSDLFPLIGLNLPPSPPYQIAGQLSRQAATWALREFSGKVGDSDLSGDFEITTGGARPKVRAELVSQQLDLDDLAGFIGAPPETGPGETAAPRQEQEAKALAERPRVLPDAEFKIERLQAMDADITFKGKSIRGRELPIDDLAADLTLENGKLTLTPLNFGVAGGNVVAHIVLDSHQNPPTADAEIHFNKLSLDQLLPKGEFSKSSIGKLGGYAELTGSGNSFAKLLASADGNAGFSMSGGQISNLLLEIVGLDGGEVIKFLFAGDETVGLRCMVADFNVKNGLMRTETFVVDTVDTNILGKGTINLATESLELSLHPLPKDFSILSGRSPLHATGTFKDPVFTPDKKALALRGGAAVLLGLVATPFAALLPLIETGPGKDSDCGNLIASLDSEAQPDKAPVGKR